jgi:hypothetical protein
LAFSTPPSTPPRPTKASVTVVAPFDANDTAQPGVRFRSNSPMIVSPADVEAEANAHDACEPIGAVVNNCTMRQLHAVGSPTMRRSSGSILPPSSQLSDAEHDARNTRAFSTSFEIESAGVARYDLLAYMHHQTRMQDAQAPALTPSHARISTIYMHAQEIPLHHANIV